MRSLWLRWTWRDLRSRWAQVLSTALIIAVGIGAWSGLRGLERWRELSADRSLAATKAHDLRVDLPDGAFVPAGRLTGALRRLRVGSAEERLIANSQIDASRPGKPVLVPARLIGIPVRPGGQRVDSVASKAGSGLLPGSAAAVLDWNFAHHYKLPASGRVRLAGLGSFPYSGLGVSPQFFLIVGDSGISGGESGIAVVYLPLADAQRAAGRNLADPDRRTLSRPVHFDAKARLRCRWRSQW
jgi:putative ABC transport system permease protein